MFYILAYLSGDNAIPFFCTVAINKKKSLHVIGTVWTNTNSRFWWLVLSVAQPQPLLPPPFIPCHSFGFFVSPNSYARQLLRTNCHPQHFRAITLLPYYRFSSSQTPLQSSFSSLLMPFTSHIVPTTSRSSPIRQFLLLFCHLTALFFPLDCFNSSYQARLRFFQCHLVIIPNISFISFKRLSPSLSTPLNHRTSHS